MKWAENAFSLFLSRREMRRRTKRKENILRAKQRVNSMHSLSSDILLFSFSHFSRYKIRFGIKCRSIPHFFSKDVFLIEQWELVTPGQSLVIMVTHLNHHRNDRAAVHRPLHHRSGPALDEVNRSISMLDILFGVAIGSHECISDRTVLVFVIL